jgi:hypothetical protein
LRVCAKGGAGFRDGGGHAGRKKMHLFVAERGELRGAKTQRVARLHRLFTGVAGVDVRGLCRFWNTPLMARKPFVIEWSRTASTKRPRSRL